mgnify:CR=1 FL=1|jgi:hypothetical protein
MSIVYLSDKPKPEDPTTVAYIAPNDIIYNNELVGDDIWGELDDDAEEEEYLSLVGCLWPACANVDFKYVKEEMLEELSKLSMERILKKISIDNFIADLTLLDHVFIVQETELFKEIKPEDVKNYMKEHTIEFVEYEGN